MTVAAGALLLVAPAGAKSGHGQAKRAAVQACKQEAGTDRAAFRLKYGRQAMRNCVRESLVELRNAAQECRAEREEIGVEAFRLEYGNNHNGRNAFGKCVSEKVHEEPEPEVVEEPAPEVVEGDGTGTGEGTGEGEGNGTPGGPGESDGTGDGITTTDPPPA